MPSREGRGHSNQRAGQEESGRRAQRIMKEILVEHQQSRKAVMELEDVKAKYLKGDRESL
jgi:hypothetical protein